MDEGRWLISKNLMKLKCDENGKVMAGSLFGYRAFNILGMSCVLQLHFSAGAPSEPQQMQIMLNVEQCRELGRQLSEQADIICLERPSGTQ